MENANAGDKVLMVNDKKVTLKDLGRTDGGRHRLKAQFYVSGIGQIFLTAYAVEKEIDAPPARRGRPPGSPNKASVNNKAMLSALTALAEKVEQLSRSKAPDESRVIIPPEPTPESQIAALTAKVEALSSGKG